MKIYNYDNEGYLIGVSELDDSDKCQITGDWLVPAQATEKEPLAEKEGFEVKFLENEWQYIKLFTDEEKKIQGIMPLECGEKIEGSKLIKIKKPQEFYSWNGSEWFYDDGLKQAKIQEINQKAHQEIITLYPEWKQINIIRMKDYNAETQLEYEKMIAFIDEVRAYADLEVTNLEDVL